MHIDRGDNDHANGRNGQKSQPLHVPNPRMVSGPHTYLDGSLVWSWIRDKFRQILYGSPFTVPGGLHRIHKIRQCTWQMSSNPCSLPGNLSE